MTTASIVVHKSPEDQLSKALECLSKANVDKIFVIDNSDTDDLKISTEPFENVEYLKVENNGFGAGHNIAIRKAIAAGSDYHLVMNADVWWDGNVIDTLVEYLETHSDIGLLAPKTFYPDGSLQYSCRMLPAPLDLFMKRFIPSGMVEKRMNKYLLKWHDHNSEIDCPYLLGSFLFFRVSALKECGMFDERFFMYPEDIDITRRIHEKYKTIYYPKVSIIHEHQQASRKSIRMFWIHFTNMVKYFNKWGWLKDPKRKEYNKELLSYAKHSK